MGYAKVIEVADADKVFQLGWSEQENHQNIIWRGQRDSSWNLVPSMFRNGIKKNLIPLVPSELWDKEGEFASFSDFLKYIEVIVLTEYLIRADIVGTAGITLTSRLRNTRNFREVLGLWPYDEFIPGMALAQHHGIPTRMLDWTYSVYTALYFAITSVLEYFEARDYNINELDDKFSLFSMDVGYLKKLQWKVDSDGYLPDENEGAAHGETVLRLGAQKRKCLIHGEPIQFIEIPYGSNNYMRAQEGVFVLPMEIWHKTIDGTNIGIENYNRDVMPIIKYDIDLKCIPELFLRLDAIRNTAMKIYPDSRGVKESFLEGHRIDILEKAL